MAEVIRMPRLSDTMTEGVIVGWHKKVGDKVKPGDVLAEVETDKATMELESYQEGTLLYIGVEKGKAAQVDGVLAVIGKEGEDYKALLENSKDGSGKKNQNKEANKKQNNESMDSIKASNTSNAVLPAGAKEIRMPLLSDTMTEGKIVAWNKKVGDSVKSDDVLAEVETDKATMEVVGYEEGTLLYIGVEAGKAAKVNELIAIVGKAGTDVAAYVAADKRTASGAQPSVNEAEKIAQSTALAASVDVSTDAGDRVKASPLAKKLAQEKGYDINKIKGTGDGGRITRRDIDAFTPAVSYNSVAQAPAPTTAPEPTQAFSAAASTQVQAPAKVAEFRNTSEEGFTEIEVSQMRKVIARRLGESMYSAPHFYLTMEINMDNAMEARKTINEVSPVKISFNDMVIKACATALRSHPQVNSSWLGDTIRQNHHIHIGSAIALPEGLIVPVIKFADQKSLSQIASDADALYQKARDKKIQPAEFTGNTFTVSNLGMMGIEEFTAIINPPDSCILAVGAIKEIVVKKADGFGTTNVMKVTLSCDHRSVDGAVGAAFLQTLKKLIESPVTMLV